VEKDLSRVVQLESVACCAHPPAKQAGLLQPVAHRFRAEPQPFTLSLQKVVDLNCDLSNKNLTLPLVAQRERGTDGERSQVIQAFRDLML
jgi:hypothetical protein